MLHAFIAANRDEIISLTRAKVSSRAWPSASNHELNGIPLFLTQVAETLRRESTAVPYPDGAIASSAAGSQTPPQRCTARIPGAFPANVMGAKSLTISYLSFVYIALALVSCEVSINNV